jgi:imidazolonepropionase-like amidohydrolase
MQFATHFAFLSLALSSAAFAQQAAPPQQADPAKQAAPPTAPPAAPQPKPTLVLRGGRLFDAETGTVHPNGQLWIAGEKIVGEKPADAALPAGAKVVDVGDATLLPGLFDLHAHVAVPGAGSTSRLYFDASENLATDLAFGVTHVVDLHNVPAAVFPLRDLSKIDPKVARLSAAGAAFTVPGGHPTQIGIECNTVTSVAEVGERFAKLLPFKPDVVKGILEHGAWATLPKLPTLDEAMLAEIAKQAHAAKLPLFVHVWTLDEAKTAVRAGADVLAHGVYVGDVDDELIKLMKEHGTAYVPTLAVVVGPNRINVGKGPYTKERLDGLVHPDLGRALAAPGAGWALEWKEYDEKRFFQNLMKLARAGVRVGTGTDAGNPQTPHGPSLLEEITLYVEAGMKPGEALRCATLESARILRVDKEAGSLAPGKLADVTIVAGDPTQQIDAVWNVRHVFKGGIELDRAAMRKKNAERDQPAKTRAVGTELSDLVDDFEDGDFVTNWGGSWTATTDAVAPGGRSTAKFEIADGGDGSVLRITGALADGFAYGPFAGVNVQWDPQDKLLADASAMKAIVVRARGTPRSYSLSIQRAAVLDYDHPRAVIAVTEEWQELHVPLASFKQIGWGKAIPAAWNDVKGLEIVARVSAGDKAGLGAFELEIDSIRFE